MSIRDAIQRAEQNDQFITSDEFDSIIETALQESLNPSQNNNLQQDWASLADGHFQNCEARSDFFSRLNSRLRVSTLDYFRSRAERFQDDFLQRVISNVNPETGEGRLRRPNTIFQRDSRLCGSILGFLCLAIEVGEAVSRTTPTQNTLLVSSVTELMPRGLLWFVNGQGLQITYHQTSGPQLPLGPQITFREMVQILLGIQNRRHAEGQYRHDVRMYEIYTRDEYFSFFANLRAGVFNGSFLGIGAGVMLRFGESAQRNQRVRSLMNVSLAYQNMHGSHFLDHHFFNFGLGYELLINSRQRLQHQNYIDPPRSVWRFSVGVELMTNFRQNSLFFHFPAGAAFCPSQALCISVTTGPVFADFREVGIQLNSNLQWRFLHGL